MFNLRGLEHNESHSVRSTLPNEGINIPLARGTGKTKRILDFILDVGTRNYPITVLVPDQSHAREYDYLVGLRFVDIIIVDKYTLPKLSGRVGWCVSDDVPNAISIIEQTSLIYKMGYYTPEWQR